MMQGYVNNNYEAVISLVIRNGNKLKQIRGKAEIRAKSAIRVKNC